MLITFLAFLLLGSPVVLLGAPVVAADTGSVTGQVVDAGTGAGLARVLVVVEDGGPSTHTDESGRFSLTAVPLGRHKLFVSLVGYALTRRDIDVPATGLDLTIPLTEGTGTYTETVTVAADRFTTAEPAVAAQQVLGSADLQNLRGVLADDPLRAVQVLPGVAATDDLRSEFSVRGSDFSHVNLTVDGFPTPFVLHTVRAVEDSSGSGSVAMINSDILQDVALLSGGYPQRFGNRTGAEIDFRLREGSRDRTHARVAVSGTSASTVLEGPLGASKRASWLLSARQSYLDLIVNQIDGGSNLQFGFTDAQAKVVFDVSSSQKLELTMIGGRSRAEEHSGDLDSEDTFVGRNASAIAIGAWRRTTSRAVVGVRALVSSNWFDNRATDGVRIDEGGDHQRAVRFDAGLSARKGIYVEGGADVERTDEDRFRQRFTTGRYRTINDFSGHATRTGVYVQTRLDLGRATFVPGVRADRWSLTGDRTTSPWLQAQLSLPWSVMLRGGAGIYQQFPAFEQVIGRLAAPETRPQRATQYDLGIEQRLGEALRWQVTVYDREEEGFFRRPLAETRLRNNLLVRGSRSAPFAQTLDGFARGVELLVQRKSTTGLSGWISYAYAKNRYHDTSSLESFDGDNDQRHTFNIYGFLRKSDRVSFSAKARLGSNTPAPGYFSETNGVFSLSNDRNRVRLPAYSRVDVRANRTFNWSRSRLTLFAEVMNILNRDNVRFNPPRINSTTRRVTGLFERMIPVLPSLGVLIEF
ncbi:MAG TPA: carboxypeptidase-like regulatory domain-containing protein [Vicinamibacterales bacterium]|nr:carboxypeptidase-like regulatory domain-containing protein [Vicinamibacterales bacterium]